MKPAWDRLIKEYNPTSSDGLVADVDCTAAGKPLCEKAGVKGYPTIKWGDPNSLQDYQGGRDFDTLLKFAKESLKPQCSPANLDPCSDDERSAIADLQALDPAELDRRITEAEGQISAAEDGFKKKVEKLQKKYQKLQTEKDEAIEAVKNSGLGLMKSVKAAGGGGKTEL